MSDNFNNELDFIYKEIQGSSGFSLNRKREYDGQSHTVDGIRGKEIVSGLTMRDISDCIVLGLLDASRLNIKNPIHDDIYKIDLKEFDPGAAIQNAICHIERYMDIFPNLKKKE